MENLSPYVCPTFTVYMFIYLLQKKQQEGQRLQLLQLTFCLMQNKKDELLWVSYSTLRKPFVRSTDKGLLCLVVGRHLICKCCTVKQASMRVSISLGNSAVSLIATSS